MDDHELHDAGASPEAPRPRPDDDWEQHWQAYADAASLNPAQAFRRQLVVDWLGLARAPAPVRVLELGSGQGDFGRELCAARPGIELLGLDRSQAGLAIARRKVPQATFVCCDLEQPIALPERYRGWATHAVCSEVLEHVAEPSAVLRHAWPFLAPGARLVVTVPGGPRSAFDRHIGHRRHFDRDALGALLRDAGYEVGCVAGAGFPFFDLYRLAVIASGRSLVRRAADPALSASLLGRAASRLFRELFRLNLAPGRLGWQRVAWATRPAVPA